MLVCIMIPDFASVYKSRPRPNQQYILALNRNEGIEGYKYKLQQKEDSKQNHTFKAILIINLRYPLF